MVSFWWLLVAYGLGLIMGAGLYNQGYFHREYNGDADE